MKRFSILTLLVCSLSMSARAQDAGIAYVLGQVEQNNKELQANARVIASQKIENKADNRLDDPTLSYAHVWDKDDSDVTEGELIVTQSFDFPTLYYTRSRLNRTKSAALDAQAEAFRQDILLQAKELCLDLIYLQRQQTLLNRRLSDAQELADLYKKRLDAGDANVIETNKVSLELLNVKTETRANRVALQNKLKELTALNGDISLAPGRGLPGYNDESVVNIPGLDEYPAVALPTDFASVCVELLSIDPVLLALSSEHGAAAREVSASRQGWLPKLELGYRRNTESGHPLNGIVVGFSIPLWQNWGRVKAAKAKATSVNLRRESAEQQAASRLWQLYDEASALHQSMQEYREAFAAGRSLDLLKQALLGGEISLTDYFVEATVVYDSQANYLRIESDYQKAMARIYKSQL